MAINHISASDENFNLSEEVDLDIRRQAIRGVASGVPIRAASQVLNLVSLTVTARLLAPLDFGVYSIALVVGGLFQVLAETVVGNSLVQRVLIEDRHLATARYISLWGSAIAVATCGILGPLLRHAFGTPGIAGVLMLMGVALPFKFSSAIRAAILQRSLRFQTVQVAALVGVLAGLVSTICLALLGGGVYALAVGFLANAGAECAFIRYKERSKITVSYDRSAAADIYSFSGPYFASQIFNYAALQGPVMLIGKFGGAAVLGMYNRAYSLLYVPVNLFGGVSSKVIFASISRLQRDTRQLQKMLILTLDAVTGILIPVSIGAALSAHVIISTLYGPQWLPAETSLTILMSLMFARVGYIVPEAMLVATGYVRSSARRQGVYAIASIAFTALGVWLDGLTGATAGVGLGILVFYVSSILALNHIVNKPWLYYVKLHLRGLFIALPCILVWDCLENRLISDHLGLGLLPALGYFVTLATVYLCAPERYIGGAVHLRRWLKKHRLLKNLHEAH